VWEPGAVPWDPRVVLRGVPGVSRGGSKGGSQGASHGGVPWDPRVALGSLGTDVTLGLIDHFKRYVS